MGDYAEMMLLSILSAALACEWHITPLEKATLTIVVFIGMMLSGALWGKFCDMYGRKLGIWFSTILIAYYGFLSSFSPNFIWILILRFVTGFAVGGVPQAFTLLSEFSPKKHRARVFSLLSLFGPLGTCLTTALAIVIMPVYGWRYLLVICAIPCCISSILCYYLPESARYYLASGKRDLAIKVLQNVAKSNKKPLPDGKLVEIRSSQVRPGRFSDLLSKKHRLHTVVLWMIWFTNTFSYYGIVLLTAEIFQVGNVCEANSNSQASTATCTSKCLTTSDYNDYFISSLAEFPAYFLTVLMVDKLGRLRTISITLFAFSLFTFLLNICVARVYLTAFFTIARFFITITFQAIYVYTPEYYPTSIRALGMGTCGTVSRIGSILTAFISQVVYSISPRLAICLYGATAAVAGFLCFLLPETKDRELEEVTSDE